MRALMKGNALEYFRKKDKPLENPETKLNELEAKLIAKEIGIDSEEISTFEDFFSQVSKIKLPQGYQRCANRENNKIVYYNAEAGLEQPSHPLIDIIKVTFYQIISDSTSIASFNAKSGKLLNFVEEKMIKQCIGLSSKRRDAEKTNMQRDENGKIVVSKLTRIRPDLRALISSRSYMIKALVEKVYTKKEIWGRGKKAAVYAGILAAEKGNKQIKNIPEEEEAETEESLETYEKIFVSSKEYYDREFGKIEDFPQELKETKEYYKSTPESVLRNLNILNIDKSNIEIFWLARVMECLPLPSGWVSKPGDTFTRYFFEPLKLLFDIHPSYIYICELINEFKLNFREMNSMIQNYYSNMKEMIFYDFFERSYKVDLFAYLEKVDELPLTKKKLIKKSEELGKNDWMVMEGFRNSELSTSNLVILEDILEYWEKINWKEDNYSPAISPYGQIIWSSNINQRTIDFCPHEALLKNLVSKKVIDLPNVKKEELKDLSFNEGFYEKISTERELFLKHYVRNDPKPLSTPYETPSNYDLNEYFDSVFISPFNMEADLQLNEGEVPIWLQKVHAEKSKQIFNSMISYEEGISLNELKEEFGGYAIKMIETHEPNRTEDIKKVISQISTKKEFKKFIEHINDVDSREERKRLLMGDGFGEDEESFGSSISQIKMEELEESSLESEDELIEIEDELSSCEEKEKSDKESFKSLSSSKKSSNQNIISEVEEEKEEDQRPEKYHSQIYLPDHKLESLGSYQLSEKLELLKSEKILKHKYSRANIKESIGKITKQSPNPDMIEEYKRNLLISRFTSEHSPYRISPDKIMHNNIKISSGINMLDISESFSPFRSEASILGNEDMSADLKKYKPVNLNETNENLNLEETKIINAADETHETIELIPLKRIKPDIREDPCLTHISAFKGVDIFRKTFNPDRIKEHQPGKEIEEKEKKFSERTVASLGKTMTDASMLSLKSQKSFSNIKIKERLLQTSREKYGETMFPQKVNVETPRIGKSHSVLGLNSALSPHHPKLGRVCLADTACGLLEQNPIKKKGDVIRMEAQKSLLSKGRGLNTLLVKMY